MVSVQTSAMSLAPFNLTIPDQSPTFRYSPYSDGDINGGWNVTYTGISDSSYVVHTSQSIGQGISTHRTSFVGASASIEWTGTAVYLIGSSQGGGSAYTTSVDDSTALPGQPNSDQHLLASYTGLNYGDHTLTLDVVEPSLINLSAAIITVGIGAPGYGRMVIHVTAQRTDTSLSVGSLFRIRRTTQSIFLGRLLPSINISPRLAPGR